MFLLHRPLVALVLFSFASAVDAAGPSGFSIVDNELRYVDLFDGTYEVIGPTGFVDGSRYPLADGPGGFIYGIKASASSGSELYRFNLTNGQGELIGSLETPNGAQDPQKTLMLLPDRFLYSFGPQGNLYRIDPATADMTLVQELALPSVFAATALGSDIYVFYEPSVRGCGYGRVDTQTATFQPLGIHPYACADTAATTADGQLLLINTYFGIIYPAWDVFILAFNPSNPAESMYYSSWMGEFFDPGNTYLEGGIVRVQGEPVVDVPATNLVGRLFFAVSLILAAAFLLHTTHTLRN